ncbi:MAG: alanine racemase [Sphingobacteriales bacterium BACL12 MAG-120813-bin55]|jgi:PLP dependent protein|nr:MAG: alanine racemase [Sphingobacteriales bacterium BACL12 MAG-120813-bin55]
MTDNYLSISRSLREVGVTLVAVSKTRTVEEISKMYAAGQRDFGENKVQELTDKAAQLPDDIRWHLIGHLQKNKVKYIADFVHLIHSVDSLALLEEINKRGAAANRVIPCLLQIFIASEPTKFGLSEEEALAILSGNTLKELPHVRIDGLMGMATMTEDAAVISAEFNGLRQLFTQWKQIYFQDAPHFNTLSMGMSSDYELAIAAGSNMVRIGTLLFGPRN